MNVDIPYAVRKCSTPKIDKAIVWHTDTYTLSTRRKNMCTYRGRFHTIHAMQVV